MVVRSCGSLRMGRERVTSGEPLVFSVREVRGRVFLLAYQHRVVCASSGTESPVENLRVLFPVSLPALVTGVCRRFSISSSTPCERFFCSLVKEEMFVLLRDNCRISRSLKTQDGKTHRRR